MQIIAQLQGSKGKHRAYSRAYESPRNGQFTQYQTSGRKTGNGTSKGVSSTGNGVSNQRRINQTIDVGAAMEHLDLDVGLGPNAATPQDLTTIQPDLTSPLAGAKLHQPATPNLQNPGQAPATANNYMMVN